MYIYIRLIHVVHNQQKELMYFIKIKIERQRVWKGKKTQIILKYRQAKWIEMKLCCQISKSLRWFKQFLEYHNFQFDCIQPQYLSRNVIHTYLNIKYRKRNGWRISEEKSLFRIRDVKPHRRALKLPLWSIRSCCRAVKLTWALLARTESPFKMHLF